jgi:hypothetical protein
MFLRVALGGVSAFLIYFTGMSGAFPAQGHVGDFKNSSSWGIFDTNVNNKHLTIAGVMLNLSQKVMVRVEVIF